MQTHVCWENMHIFLWTMKDQFTLLGMKSKGTLASNMKTVSGALAYDNPTSGTTVIIVVHQAIHFPTMDCNLI